MTEMRPIISRKDAKSLGLAKYFTGIACACGHISERYVRNWECLQCRRHAPDRTRLACQPAPERTKMYRARVGRPSKKMLVGPTNCGYCDNPVLSKPGRGRGRKWCSDDCTRRADNVRKSERSLPGRLIRENERARTQEAKLAAKAAERAVKATEAERQPMKECLRCSTLFKHDLRYPWKTHCSRRCKRAKTHRISGKARRARLAKLPNKWVDPLVVFERDQWICYLCGMTTRKQRGKRGEKRHPMSAVLEHKVPLALGGHHTYENTACACHECNAKKGARLHAKDIPEEDAVLKEIELRFRGGCSICRRAALKIGESGWLCLHAEALGSADIHRLGERVASTG